MWYSCTCKNSQTGFIPDIVTLFHKYGISRYLNTYVSDSSFPDKQEWKRIVNRSLLEYVTIRERTLCAEDVELMFYNQLCLSNDSVGQIVYDNTKIHVIWQLIPKHRNMSAQLIFLASLCTVTVASVHKDSIVCNYCNSDYNHILVHLITACPKYLTAREVYWNMLTDILSPQGSVYLHALSD
jgi:hypothetical protein